MNTELTFNEFLELIKDISERESGALYNLDIDIEPTIGDKPSSSLSLYAFEVDCDYDEEEYDGSIDWGGGIDGGFDDSVEPLYILTGRVKEGKVVIESESDGTKTFTDLNSVEDCVLHCIRSVIGNIN